MKINELETEKKITESDSESVESYYSEENDDDNDVEDNQFPPKQNKPLNQYRHSIEISLPWSNENAIEETQKQFLECVICPLRVS